MKKNVTTIDRTFEKVASLRKMLLRGVSQSKKIELIAQEVEKVLPEIVATHSQNGNKSVDYANLVAVLV
jgi:hypothetical protein